MPTFSYGLEGIATRVELGNGGTILDASRLSERRGQNAGLAPNLVQSILTLPNASTVDIPVCDVGSVVNSLTHIRLVILVSSSSGRADLVLERTYTKGLTSPVIVHSTQTNSTNIVLAWSLTFSFTQIFSVNSVFYRLSNNTGSTVQYSVGLHVDRHNL